MNGHRQVRGLADVLRSAHDTPLRSGATLDAGRSPFPDAELAARIDRERHDAPVGRNRGTGYGVFYLLVATVVAVFAITIPIAGVVAAAAPSRANRWVAGVCAVAVVLAATWLAVLVWEEATRTCPPSAMECGDDSGLIFLMSVPAILILVTNVPAGVAAWLRRPRSSRQPRRS